MVLTRWFPKGMARWDPVREIFDLHNEMNRVFDSFLARPSGHSLARVWAPVVDLYETKDEVVVTAKLPGVKEKEINVSIVGEVLTIKGEQKEEQETKDERYHRVERFYGAFERQIPLPVPVETEKVKATYKDGVLAIHLPKAETIKPKAIKVEAA